MKGKNVKPAEFKPNGPTQDLLTLEFNCMVEFFEMVKISFLMIVLAIYCSIDLIWPIFVYRQMKFISGWLTSVNK